MSDWLFQVGVHPGLQYETAYDVPVAFCQHSLRMEQSSLFLAEYIVHAAFKSASLFYFSNHPTTG